MIQATQFTKAALILAEAQKQMTDLLGCSVVLFFELDSNTMISTTYIIRTVSQLSGVSVDEILGKSRTQEACNCRFVCFSLMQKYQGMNKTEIGRVFNRDHSTVINGLDVITNEPNNKPLQDLLLMAEEVVKRETNEN